MPDIEIPHKWNPRKYQLPFWVAMQSGVSRAVLVWPRRHGKDDVCLHWMCVAAMQKPATYWYMLPEAAQARKAIWKAVNPHTGLKRIDEAFPTEIVAKKNDAEMYLELVNGSTVQIVGSDNYNSLVGSPPFGVVFSEWALANPDAWAYLRPILKENGGWAVFNGTPRGRNHHSTMYEAGVGDDSWFSELLTYKDANVFDEPGMKKEREEYRREHGVDQGNALFEQEYMCSFDAAIMGAYYSGEMAAALKEGRITKVAHDKGKPVHTMWDLGRSDSTVVWLFQEVGNTWNILRCIANSGVNLDYFAKELGKHDYTWGTHYIPHDGAHERIGMAKSIDGQLRDLIAGKVVVVPSPPGSRQVGINEVRKRIGMCAFDIEGCGTGLEALRMYRKGWDDKNKRFRDTPLHDWSSDYADSFRCGVMGFKEKRTVKPIDYGKMNNGVA